MSFKTPQLPQRKSSKFFMKVNEHLNTTPPLILTIQNAYLRKTIRTANRRHDGRTTHHKRKHMDTADTVHIYDVSKQKPTPKRQPRHRQKFENTNTPVAQATQCSIYTNH